MITWTNWGTQSHIKMLLGCVTQTENLLKSYHLKLYYREEEFSSTCHVEKVTQLNWHVARQTYLALWNWLQGWQLSFKVKLYSYWHCYVQGWSWGWGKTSWSEKSFESYVILVYSFWPLSERIWAQNCQLQCICIFANILDTASSCHVGSLQWWLPNSCNVELSLT